jgi:hypothetical protein
VSKKDRAIDRAMYLIQVAATKLQRRSVSVPYELAQAFAALRRVLG